MRLSTRQSDMLSSLADAPAPSKMALVRRLYSGRGHAASYATIKRLAARGLVRYEQGARRCDVAVAITDAGRAAIA